MEIVTTAARVATLFGRQRAAYSLTVDEVAADAIRIAKLAKRVRTKLERQRPHDAELEAFRAIADRYEAKTVAQLDLDGCVVALKFRDGLYSSGFRNLFFVA